MPTTYQWVGTTSGDFATATNWSPNSSAGGPVAGDTIIFRNSAIDLNATLDQSAKAFAAVSFESTYTGVPGLSAASPFKFDATTLTVKSGANGFIKGVYTNAVIDLPSAALVWSIDSAGTTTGTQVKRGCANFVGGTYTTVFSTARNNDSAQAIVILAGATFTAWNHERGIPRHTSGTITTYRATNDTLYSTGGTVTNAHLHQAAGWTDNSGNATTLLQVYSAQGRYDASGGLLAKTITTIKGNEAASINTTNGPNNITVTNQQNLLGQTVASYGVLQQAA